jgi:hypothetical protein
MTSTFSTLSADDAAPGCRQGRRMDERFGGLLQDDRIDTRGR